MEGAQKPTSAIAYAGPLLTPVTSTSTPSTPRLRKRQKEGSSEDDGPLLLGDNEIHNEDYRCGGPSLVRLPAQNRHLAKNDEFLLAYKELEDAIIHVLHIWSIDVQGRTPLQRAHQTEGSVTWVNTILISARKHELSNTWFRACKEIRQILLDNNLGDVSLEMIDERASQRILSAPVPREDPFCSMWEDLRSRILNILGDKEWTMLSPQKRGISGGNTPVTIVILVREDSTSDWTVVREAIVEILDSMELHHVAVELRRGSLLQFHTRPSEEGFLTKDDWSFEPCMGGSIGPHSSTFSSFTFGGFVEVQHPSEGWKLYGLTNHHCVTALNSTADWDKQGIMPGDPENNLTIDYPSLDDHLLAIQHYKAKIEELSSSESYVSIKKRMDEHDPSVSRNEQHAYECTRTEISHLKNTLNHAHRYYLRDQLLLGKVYASSGYRMNIKKCILDWALLEVDSNRVSKNKLPSINDIPRGSRASYLATKEVLDGPVALGEEMGVCKTGRSTGFSEGMLGEIRETDIQCWFRDASGNWDKRRGLAYLVYPKAPRLTFGEPGDSGSFVFSLQGSFVGLYMGGDREAGTGLLIEASDLLEDIKQVTGALDVRIPS
ncbi:TPA_exp: Uncharacterized protein A8136_2811 [Trichophyton benhamiae CBS 112371]|uniref:Uncharacterized protein n=1 Tax=Arthroderma benhamiae (strain ATCC MYA-4681 / CBS 112371) TaxID=663331 RepID=D4ALG1_ARTBC|nr:uncharacterized protein ARB_05158 [Trichophyton benhamiae CBS 112371]EFE36220.1 hypothetical protein ARB_05158 [Trichophyton benhamiae CBS 112371]DAA79026.1 TPA_exp: Uncharacterized protein A8136_2811 [Trichophyton benhamiae CBS 112371]